MSAAIRVRSAAFSARSPATVSGAAAAAALVLGPAPPASASVSAAAPAAAAACHLRVRACCRQVADRRLGQHRVGA